MSRWYRAYEGTVTDAKLAEAAMIADVSRAVSIAAWHCLLESAASVNNCGGYETSPRRVSIILCEPPAAVEALFAAYAELGLIGDGAVLSWKKRQFASDSSAERVAKHRAKKREETAENESVTANETLRNAPEQNRTETDTEITTTNPARASDCFNEVCKAAGWHPRTDTKRRDGLSIIDGWLALGCSLELILESIKYGARNGEPTSSLKRFDGLIRKKRREQLGGELPITANDVAAIAKQVGSKLRAA